MKSPAWWLVVWQDAETAMGWEKDEDVKVDRKPASSVGVIVRESDGFLVLGADIGRCGAGRQTNRRIEIPVQNIIRRVRLVQSKNRRTKDD